MRRAPCSMPSPVASARSAPEQKTRPSAAHQHDPDVGVGVRGLRCANSSVTSWRDSALRLCWESRVMVATASATA